jgi:protein TonB
MILSSAVRVFAQTARKAKTTIQPVYPELARKNNIQGTVRLEITIAPDGSVKNIKVLGGSPVLAQAATEAVKKWKYEPAPTETSTVLPFDFKP